MSKNAIENEMRKLEEKINYHAHKYHVEDSPEISDFDYDKMFYRLVELENENPQFASSTSPTKRIGGNAIEKFEKVTHNVLMGSLRDVFDYNGVIDFIAKTPTTDGYSVECKIDGLSVSLIYENGIFIRGATRGDGYIGENITENLKTIPSLPLSIPYKGHLVVRGEVFISRSNFEKLNETRALNDEPLFANPRNAAAGSLRQLNPKITAERKLDIFVFNIQSCDTEFTTHQKTIDFLYQNTFKIIPFFIILNKSEDIIKQIEKIGETRYSLPFDIDGMVIKINNLRQRTELGETSNVPKWAVAFKFPPEEKETILEDININVGRTGVLTPYAMLRPLHLAGSVVSRATLHNYDFISERDIRVGDTVLVRKAGDIIPEILCVNLKKRLQLSPPFEMPKTCPSCSENVEKDPSEAAYYCTNSSCPAKFLRGLGHFVSRNAMNIDGLGEAILERLIANELIFDFADIYSLQISQLSVLDHMGEKSATNLINAINSSKNRGLDKLLFALGIRQVGEKAAKMLALEYGDIDKFFDLTVSELCQIKDVGTVTAENIINYFTHPSTKNLIEKLKNSGVQTTCNITKIDNRFKGKTFVLTGTLPTLSRAQASEIIEKHSGKISSSVSKNVSYVLVGDDAGSKLTKAKELNIPIITENDLILMIK